MNGSEINRLKEAGLRGRLSPEEQARWEAHLAGHPEEQDAWGEELRLNLLLRRLPDAPVASNFTAQVLGRIARDGRAPDSARRGWFRFPRAGWPRRLAFAAVLLSAGLIAFDHQQNAGREELARSVAALSPVIHFPTVEMLDDFEAIQRLNRLPSESDVELLLALQ